MSDDIRVVMKAVTWEKAKGNLRALVAIQGSYFYDAVSFDYTVSREQKCSEAVENFIKEMEENALSE